jgi:ankyrin repeat protein
MTEAFPIGKEDNFGNIPLHYAIKTGNEEIMNHLLALSSMKDVGVVYNEVEYLYNESIVYYLYENEEE